MKETILSALAEIERKENVRIIYCVESGSRAWGFPSPTSDYDVRFVYVRPKEFYLRLDPVRDVIEWQLDDTLDVNGWDIYKLLSLLHKSNPTIFEWQASPIVYKTTEEWKSISRVIADNFSVKHSLYHYLFMAKRHYHEATAGEKAKLKKYLYCLRPLLACKWIIKKSTPPPMLFSSLVSECLDDSVKGYVDRLVELKMGETEIKEVERIPELEEYLARNISEIETNAATVAEKTERSWDALNKAFLAVL